MNIILNPNKPISSLKKDFNILFPYLKIEIFNKPNTSGEASAKNDMLKDEEIINKYSTINEPTILEIHPSNTVSQVEKMFEKTCGLSIQIFRKSGKLWLETTITDNWTLKQQNEHGELLSSKPETFKEEVDEADIQ